MADKWYAILTPADDLDSDHWLAIERVEFGGPEAVLLGLRIRKMAVKAGRAGLIAKANGEPMTLDQMRLALGYTLERVTRGLNLLHSFGLVSIDDGGGIWSADPVVLEHFAREASAYSKRLPAPDRGPKKQERPLILVLDGGPPDGETKAAREKRLGRNRKRTADYRAKWGCNPDHIEYSVTPSVTHRDDRVTVPLPEDGNADVTASPQVADNICKIPALPPANIKEVKVTNTSSCVGSNDDDVLDDGINISQVLFDVPAPQRVKVGNSIRKALATGHSLHVCHEAIDAARKEATPGSPWVGLALYKLGELTKPESLPSNPPKQASKPVEAATEPVPTADPAADEAFKAALADPGTPLYQAMYARTTNFAKEMGEDNAAFVRDMREAFCFLTQQPQDLSALLG